MGIEHALSGAEPNEELLNQIRELLDAGPMSEEDMHAQLISFIKGSGSDNLSDEEIEKLLIQGTRPAKSQ